jgi:hypothetical protein
MQVALTETAAMIVHIVNLVLVVLTVAAVIGIFYLPSQRG